MVLKTVSLELSSTVETVYLKTKKIARTHENITFCNTISFGFAKPQEHTERDYTLKLTLTIASQRKVIKIYLNNS